MAFRTIEHSKPLPPQTKGCPSTDHSFLALPHFRAPPAAALLLPAARHVLSPTGDLVLPCGSPATTADWLLEAWGQKLTKKEQISCHHQPWRIKEEKISPQEKAEHGQITVRAATSPVTSGCWPPALSAVTFPRPQGLLALPHPVIYFTQSHTAKSCSRNSRSIIQTRIFLVDRCHTDSVKDPSAK